MHPIRPYENDSLCEIDSDQKERGKNVFKQKSKKADIFKRIVSNLKGDIINC